MPLKMLKTTFAASLLISPIAFLQISFADEMPGYDDIVDPNAYSEEFVALPPPKPKTIKIETPIPQVELGDKSTEKNDQHATNGNSANGTVKTAEKDQDNIKSLLDISGNTSKEAAGNTADLSNTNPSHISATNQPETTAVDTPSSLAQGNQTENATDNLSPANNGSVSAAKGTPAALNNNPNNANKLHWPTVLAAFLALLSLAILLWLLLLKMSNAPAKASNKSFY